jgi:glutathione synthase/RimK-type ligase-like ATP-grasp enzyme
MKEEGWDVYILTRKTYKGKGIFEGGWLYDAGKFSLVKDTLKVDLVYDRTGGVIFPVKDDNLRVVNEHDFKILAWDKWATSRVIGEYMPQTFDIDNKEGLPEVLNKIKTDWVVLKPFNGLKGIGIFIGPKEKALEFKFDGKYNHYVAQEFVDTSNGISGITSGKHDLRVVIINSTPVWCHVRVPVGDSFLANAAQGGNLTEVNYEDVPESIKNVVKKVSTIFSSNYDNPIYSLDFGVDRNGNPFIFEINDQMGFPKWDMDKRDIFLKALITNFKSKLARE